MISRLWRDLAWTDSGSLPADAVAVLPVSVDATINAGLLARALELAPPDAVVLALPMQSVGLSVEHVRFPGTLTLSAETLITLLTETGRSGGRAGVRRLVILNSHGGQPQVVDIVCRRLRGDGLFAASCMASRLGLPPEVALTRRRQPSERPSWSIRQLGWRCCWRRSGGWMSINGCGPGRRFTTNHTEGVSVCPKWRTSRSKPRTSTSARRSRR